MRSDEGVISPQDEQLVVVRQWLTKNPGAQDVCNLWETANPRQYNFSVSIISVLAATVPLLSSHYAYHALGYLIIKTLLTPRWMRKSNLYIRGAHNELILVTVKLLIGISEFAGGKEEKSLLDISMGDQEFAETIISSKKRQDVSQTSRKTRRIPKSTSPPSQTYVHSPTDICPLYILFLLSFLGAPTQTKNTFLEQHRDAFSSIFQGLSQDHYLFIRHAFETLWVHLLSDPKIKRTTKIGIFDETFLIFLKYMKGRVRRMILWNMYPWTSYTISF